VTDLAINAQGGDESVSTASEETAIQQTGDAVQEPSPDTESDDGDDTAEIEHNGQCYRVPKPLKGAFLMHADYTRKTQDVAEQRRALAERDAFLSQQTQLQAEHLQDVGRLLAYNNALAQYEQLNWDALRAHNPAHTQALLSQYMNVKNHRDGAANLLQAKVDRWRHARDAQDARQYAECQAVLTRDIKEWSPALSGRLKEFGMREFGFAPHEVASVSDPRLIKVLYRAMIGDQLIKKGAASARAAEQEGIKPLPQLGGSAAATRWDPRHGASDRASTAEWMKRRNEQVRSGT
jgi:hypothetical protein